MNKNVSIVFFGILLLCSSKAFSQTAIDVLNYRYDIELNDKNDTIKAVAFITFISKQAASSVTFDLTNINKDQQGMDVISASFVSPSAFSAVYQHTKDKLIINSPMPLKKGDTARVYIRYKGIPADGLIISKNKYGHRTFFSDNWPNRAHKWIPCVDDPADKASIEFVVTAPSHYEVVSNGVLIEETNLPDNKKLTHWKEEVPLPTKIMVIGVADFAVDTVGVVNGIPVTSWVYPENKKDGFYYFAPAKNILSFFINYIGPYPYKKLANVQSKTIYGGMENASAIFYAEDLATGYSRDERLLAHEIAHQWFGDMATEKNFAHLWLSEGFVTYLSTIFIESKYGTDSLNHEMQKDRDEVVAFAYASDRPVVDTVSSYMQLLNANSYQKGGWVLHMLRRQLGDSVFHNIIRNYYSAYAGKNADTKDFQKICENVSGKNLEAFFQQWLYTPHIPILKVKWSYSATGKNILLVVEQLQNKPFQFPLDVELVDAAGKSQLQTLSISNKKQEFSIPVSEKTSRVYLDPATSLLFGGTVSKVN